jgi:hypothetical protein
MPLSEGRTLSPAIAAESRPQEPFCAIEDVDVLFPDGNVRGRRAPDATNWCRCCDTTISTNERAAFCATHRTARNTAQKKVDRGEDRPRVVGVRLGAIDVVVSRTDRLQEALGRATAEFNRMPKPPVGTWIDDLMLIAKDLTHAVDHGLRPVSSHRRIPERERRRPAPDPGA